MRWEAIHRTGADPHADATFDLGTASLLGLPVPLDSLHDLGESVNEVLAPIGLTVQFPRVERFEDPADLVRITPLRIVVRDTQVGKALLGPLLDISRTQREQIGRAACRERVCQDGEISECSVSLKKKTN